MSRALRIVAAASPPPAGETHEADARRRVFLEQRPVHDDGVVERRWKRVIRRHPVIRRERAVAARARDRNRPGACQRTTTEHVRTAVRQEQDSIAVALRNRPRREFVGPDAADVTFVQVPSEILAINLVDGRKDCVACCDCLTPRGDIVECRPWRERWSWCREKRRASALTVVGGAIARAGSSKRPDCSSSAMNSFPIYLPLGQYYSQGGERISGSRQRLRAGSD